MIKKVIITFMFLFISICPVYAEQREGFINDVTITINDSTVSKYLNDNSYNTKSNIYKTDTLKLTSKEEFDSVYIVYYLKNATGNITVDKQKIKIGNNEFLHEYIELDSSVTEATINYDEDVTIKEIFLFSGDVPSWVQQWKPPCEKADIILLSTHSDDEHLFFAGLIPTMIANNKKIQVVYLANHNDTPSRLDEQLNGLWAVGLSNYPSLGVIPDAYSETLDGAIKNLKSADMDLDDVTNYIIDIINEYKPDVIVGHDEQGEYGHGQHRLYTYALEQALEKMDDNSKPYKVYLHLYNENTIKMDYDIPLDYYDGKTAYEVSKLGYKEHLSQQYTWFTKWLTGVDDKGKGNLFTKATEIKKYSPLDYGLYYSKVGYENEDNNMFYNIPITKEEKVTTKKRVTVKKETGKVKHNYTLYIILGIVELILSTLLFICIIKKKHRK